jgi:predicted protein tyrosine phosphatase
MIHVCSLARLHETVEETGARHVVTLLRDIDRVQRPHQIAAKNHLILSMDDITYPVDGYTHPSEDHVTRLIEFVTVWDRRAPLVMHCFAGISRSTAGAFISACAINPQRNETAIAQAIRGASSTAMPNIMLVTLADRMLDRQGRMIDAVKSIGAGRPATEGEPFQLDPE